MKTGGYSIKRCFISGPAEVHSGMESCVILDRRTFHKMSIGELQVLQGQVGSMLLAEGEKKIGSLTPDEPWKTNPFVKRPD